MTASVIYLFLEHGPLTFGSALESYRLGEEMSQAELAKKMGISSQSLCDIEKGRRIPTPTRAARIANVIGEPEIFWVKLAMQDGLRKENLNFIVSLVPTNNHVNVETL